MITDLHIKGFKSIVDKSVSLNKLTLLTGLNSSGKSSVIQALRILDHQARGLESPLLEGHGSVEELQNIFVKEPFSLTADYIMEGVGKSVRFTPNCSKEMSAGFPEIVYVSAARFGPRTSIPIFQDNHIGENGENVLKVIDEYQDVVLPDSLRHPKSEGDSLYFNLRGWLSSISPGVKFNHELQRKTDSSFATFNGHRSTNVGFGLSYILPVIAALLIGSVNPGSVVVIENPEAHLHPKGQTELAFLACLVADSGCQVIIETHSDHFFDGVRVFTKRHPYFSDHVAIHWLELNSDGSTQISSPLLKPDGKLTFWPKGLFDQFETNAEELL